MKAIISRKLIETTKPSTSVYDIRCTRMKGLIVRVQPSGNKSFYCEFERSRRIKIGSTDHLSIKEAHTRLKEVMRDVYDGKDPARSRRSIREEVNLNDFIGEYYKPWAISHLRSGVALSKRLVSAFPTLQKTKLSQISIFQLEKWRAGRLQSGVKASTVNRDVGALKAALSRAEEWGLIEQNPIIKLKKLKIEDITPPRYLKEDERERLFAALEARELLRIEKRKRYNNWRRERGKNEYPDYEHIPFTDYLKPMILISLNTGLRKNELFTLTWDNVHLDHPTPFVTVIAAFAKSKKSRHVQLNNFVVDVLRKWLTIWESNFKNLVFANHEGEKIDNVKSSWRNLMKDAQLTNFRWHDMRHDFASRLAMAGVNLNTIRELMGHSDYKMTLRYAHLSPNEGHKAVNMIL